MSEEPSKSDEHLKHERCGMGPGTADQLRVEENFRDFFDTSRTKKGGIVAMHRRLKLMTPILFAV